MAEDPLGENDDQTNISFPEQGDAGRPGVVRLEAFSDGVIAIIITIMVLELKAPEDPDMHSLLHLLPVMLAYLLSFVFVGIYWVNHHRLLAHARLLTNGIIWGNLALLFTLSLIPFSTAILGNGAFSAFSIRLYLISVLPPALAFTIVQALIRRHANHAPDVEFFFRATSRKGNISVVIYSLGIALSYWWPPTGMVCAVLATVMWFLPQSRIDLALARF